LSIPIAIKLYLISLIIIIVGGEFIEHYCDSFTCYNSISYMTELMSPVITYVFYILLNRSIGRCAILNNERIPNQEDSPDHTTVR
jgi:hypothetical protein